MDKHTDNMAMQKMRWNGYYYGIRFGNVLLTDIRTGAGRKGEEVKQCQCSAHNYDECVCGAWDDMDPYKLREQLGAAREERDTARARTEQVERIVKAMNKWLEDNQEDVFRRGIWDAILEANDERGKG